MANAPTDGGVRVVRAAEAGEQTAQTPGMTRAAGVDASTTGATRIWMGRVTAPPEMDSGPHHHGESESAVYMVSGRIRLCWGENYEQCHDLGPGDFAFVPPHLPHVERNLSGEPAEFIVARSPDNIVVNLD